MTREEWIKIYNAKDGTWDKDDLIDKAYEIISSPIKTNYDLIKSMSVEEMANFLSEAEWKAMQGKSKYPHEWERWLLQEVSDE